MSEDGVTFREGDDNYLEHYGIKRRSGRYPWGSGDTPEQRGRDFLSTIEELRRSGMSEADIAKAYDHPEQRFTTADLRATRTTARNEIKQAEIARAYHMKYEKGMSNVAIGQAMGLNESSVRALLDPSAKEKADILLATSNMLKDQVAQKEFVDVGVGVEKQLGISDTKLKVALKVLEEEGYKVIPVQIDQAGSPGNKTTVKVLAPPGTTYKDIVTQKEKIQQIREVSDDGGKTWLSPLPPMNISSKRVGVAYKEDGGDHLDGVIHVRRGVPDVSLGNSRYAQVRIAVDGTHYLKGMAIYKDDMPDGVDLVFNTNKSRDVGKLGAMKKMETDADGNIDPTNPFGAMINKQIGQRDATGKLLKPTSVMNIVNDEGDWDNWSRNLPAQMLSKQSPQLAKAQLDMTFEKKQNQLDSILALTNPSVKKRLLESFADEVDSSAVHLKAAALPRQRTQVIIPVPGLKDNEVHAPNFRNGERVALIRFPHGGTFEIPELVVNNNTKEGIATLGRGKGAAQDAVGINKKVADRLSGADFDGDFVLVVPNNSGKVKSTPALADLKDFDPKQSYPAYEGMKTMGGGVIKDGKEVYPPGKQPSGRTKGFEMGDVSNLITDMTIKAAPPSELARAVKHSMVVIDAEKHLLNWKLSAEQNGIRALKEKYQARPDGSAGGASTLISQATSRKDVLARKKRSAADGGFIDRTTGKKMYTETGESWVDPATGKTVYKKMRSQKLVEAEDAYELSSGTKMEAVYADHSNRLKAMANEARRVMVNTSTIPYSPSAKKTYDAEVKSLNAKLNRALANAPRERQAQVVADQIIRAKRDAKPDMEASELKKVKAQALIEARSRTGASKKLVDITDDEWKAIQAGAITANKLDSILRNSDIDQVKKLATPQTRLAMSNVAKARAQMMLANGFTQAEVADQLGVSLTTLKDGLK